LGFHNGDQIMIAVAKSGLKVFKMWAGIFPATTLWESDSITPGLKTFHDQRPLDSLIDKLIDCDRTAEVMVRLAPLI
jgi:hypothetical protein